MLHLCAKQIKAFHAFALFLTWWKRGCIISHHTLIFFYSYWCDLGPFLVPNKLLTSFVIVPELMVFVVSFLFLYFLDLGY
jgi:hypothetical protein